MNNSLEIVAGVDEAGRGPLAGPVVAAAVMLPAGHGISGIDDSKKLSAARREHLYTLICSQARVGVGIVSEAVIDEINILQATFSAMRSAIAQLTPVPALILVDGNLQIPDCPFPQRAIVGGDATEESIAAASIVAKVTRDRMMIEFHAQYPDYNFAKHKGYGTLEHRKAIQQFGLSPIHRKSFAKKLLS